MTAETVAYVVAGAMCAGFVNGLAGFGVSLFALGWWLQVLDPVDAVATSLVISVLSGLQGVWIVRRSIGYRDLARFVMPALLGIPLGLSLLSQVSPEPLKLLIALFLFAYGAFFTVQRNLPNVTQKMPVLDSVIGFLGGILGALAGLSGALPTVWLSLRPWPRDQIRAILQPYNVIILSLSAILLAFNGAYDTRVLFVLAIAVPVALASAQLGIMVFKRINDANFRRLLIALMLVSGAVLLGRSIT